MRLVVVFCSVIFFTISPNPDWSATVNLYSPRHYVDACSGSPRLQWKVEVMGQCEDSVMVTSSEPLPLPQFKTSLYDDHNCSGTPAATAISTFDQCFHGPRGTSASVIGPYGPNPNQAMVNLWYDNKACHGKRSAVVVAPIGLCTQVTSKSAILVVIAA